MSLSGEEPRTAMSLSGEEPRTAMSLSGEEPKTAMSLSGEAAPRISPVRAAMTVVAGMALAGVLVGAVWVWLAPGIRGVVALTDEGDRVQAYLGNESEHWFTAAAVMVGLLSVLAIVGAVLVWQWRAHRGPLQATALALGSIAAAAVATGVGALGARLRYGSVDVAGAPVSPENRVHYIVEAPAVFFGHSPLMVAATLLLPAAVAATTYLLCAVSTPRDDLGGWPPVEYAVGATGRSVTVAPVPPAGPSSPSP